MPTHSVTTAGIRLPPAVRPAATRSERRATTTIATTAATEPAAVTLPATGSSRPPTSCRYATVHEYSGCEPATRQNAPTGNHRKPRGSTRTGAAGSVRRGERPSGSTHSAAAATSSTTGTVARYTARHPKASPAAAASGADTATRTGTPAVFVASATPCPRTGTATETARFVPALVSAYPNPATTAPASSTG